MRSRAEAYLLGIVFLCGLTSSVLYVAQGGFAMGGYPFDLLIVVLLLPGFVVCLPLGFLLIVAGIPESRLTQFQYCLLVFLPVALNLTCARVLCTFVASRRGTHGPRR